VVTAGDLTAITAFFGGTVFLTTIAFLRRTTGFLVWLKANPAQTLSINAAETIGFFIFFRVIDPIFV
jgi:hypothetical protein